MRSFGYINSNFRDWKSAYDAGELEFEEEKGRETLERRTERDVTFCIDRGGTFTDVYCEYRSNEKKRKQTISLKLLSEDRNYASAPAEGIRRILEKIEKRTIGRDEKTPTRRIKSVRMGTTVGTNALLERKGAKVALVVTKGFRDLLTIGNQARPDIFKLSAIRPKALAEISIEANERVRPVKCSDGGEYYYHRRLSSDSNDSNAFHRSSTIVDASDVKTNEEIEIVEKFDAEALRGQLLEAKANGFTSIAAVLMHSYAYPNHEIAIGKLAEEIGFEQISLSSALTPMARAVSRGHTAAVDAYLTPKIKEYIKQFVQGFDDGLVRDVPVLFMQSDGGMTSADRFCGYKAILSGPAGGVVGYSRTATSQGEHAAVIGFDMGGTSTDVSRYDPKQGYEHVTETITAGVVVQCPQLDISTVAAGGGSKLKFFAGSFQVGPESVGSEPGPACYRKGGDLAVTDANVVLGRVLPEHFPKIFGPDEDEELDRTASLKKFELLRDEINDWFHERERQKNSDNNNNNNSRSSNSNNSGSHINLTTEDVAMGFLRVANEAMCRPIREITESKGFETSKHVLAAFGGAGPQHACAVAKALGIKSIKVHKYSGILSAFGMGLADVVRDKQTACFAKYSKENEEIFENTAKELREIVKRELMEEEGFSGETIETELYLNMRFEGTDAPMMIREPTFQSGRSFLDEFREKFRAEYGFVMENRDAIVDDVRVRGVAKSEVNNNDSTVEKELSASEEGSRISSLEQRQKSLTRTYFEGRGWMETPVFELLDLYARDEIIGPAIILNGSSTCIIEPDCFTLVTDSGDLEITVNEGASSSTSSSSAITKNSIEEDVKGDLFDESAFAHKIADPVLVSLYNNRFMGIAEQMGRTLQRTAVSTNIKERLDFSCAIFSPSGGLVANAPHVPVHLGAMSSTVSWQLNHLKDDLHDGDVIVTNHPCSGGSHLPDITVVTPVFSNNTLEFLVASRGHHADVGGATPGSMPPFSTKLSEEGVAIESFKILKRGTYDEEGLVQILKAGKARKIEDNLNDLRAQVAANARGIQLIRELMRDAGTNETREYMRFCQINAELAVRETLKAFASKILAKRNDTTSDQVIVKASDFMDDGSEIKLSLTLNSKDGSAIFDFAGTSPEVLGNWNAPPAVTVAAVIYALRCIVDEPIPLNQGCLTPVDVRIPDGCFLSPSPTAAVVGGNVLTSQRVTDVIFEAFEAAANSQGCMNNFTFGDESFGYYETIGGGAGAGPDFAGASGTQTHMTNTRITDVEILERRYPVLVNTFALRKDSGGEGKHKGGDGLIREFTFLKPLVANVLSERRERNPRGLLGGCDGERGLNLLKKNGREDFEVIGGKVSLLVEAGDVLRIETPGGGGFGLK
jgi:5-oxoprolinase (ATP-hydrolysing)